MVIDKVTQEPVPYVHVSLTNYKAGSITDPDGKFSINLHVSPEDSLRFSCIGYKTIITPVTSFSSQAVVVLLEEERVMLSSLTIRSLSAKEYIKKCIGKIRDNYKDNKTSEAFYWQSTRLDETPSEFFESYVTLSKNNILYDSIIADTEHTLYHVDMFDSLADVLKFDVINQASMFVNEDNLNDWRYEYSFSSEVDNTRYIVIEASKTGNPFKPNQNMNTLMIFINSTNYAIERIDFTYRWTDGKRYYSHDGLEYSMTQFSGTVEYRKTEDQKYSLNYLSTDAEFVFMKNYNSVVLDQSRVVHELVMMDKYKKGEKPVVRWNEYLAGSKN